LSYLQNNPAIDSIKKATQILLSGANGLLGSKIPEKLSYPAELGFRYQGENVSSSELAYILNKQKGRKKQELMVFTHGLMVDDTCWYGINFSMPGAFESNFGISTVNIYYNTGRHIWQNGRDLALALENLYNNLPDTTLKLHMVGFSMGGLVTHSALSYAYENNFNFINHLDKVFLIATPHRGAPLEKIAQGLRLFLDELPEYLPIKYVGKGLKKIFQNIKIDDKTSLSPVGDTSDFFIRELPSFYIRLPGYIVDFRSEGILDLRHGYISEEESRQDKEGGGLKSYKKPIPALPWVRYYAVTGSIFNLSTEDPSTLSNDGMLTSASAANIGPDDNFFFVENNRYKRLPGLSHFVLPYSSKVYEVLSRWFKE